MEKINWDHFPEPYNRELPFYIEKAFGRLSPEGVELLNEMVDRIAGASHGKGPDSAELPDPTDVAARIAELPEWDSKAIFAINQRVIQAFDASIDQTRGERDLFLQAASVIAQAQAIDPEFAARGDEVTLEEAVSVLEAHGVRPGISREALEMKFEIGRGGTED